MDIHNVKTCTHPYPMEVFATPYPGLRLDSEVRELEIRDLINGAEGSTQRTYFEGMAKSLTEYAEHDKDFSAWLRDEIHISSYESNGESRGDIQAEPHLPGFTALPRTPHAHAAFVRARLLINSINEDAPEFDKAKEVFLSWKRTDPRPLGSLVFGPWIRFGYPAIVAGRIAYHEEVSMVVIAQKDILHNSSARLARNLVKVCSDALSQEINRPHSPEVDNWLHGERELEIFEASDSLKIDEISNRLSVSGVAYGSMRDSSGSSSLLAITPAFQDSFSTLTNDLRRIIV